MSPQFTFSGLLSSLHDPPLLKEMTDLIRPSERNADSSGQYFSELLSDSRFNLVITQHLAAKQQSDEVPLCYSKNRNSGSAEHLFLRDEFGSLTAGGKKPLQKNRNISYCIACQMAETLNRFIISPKPSVPLVPWAVHMQ